MTSVPNPRMSPRQDGLRALVDLASGDLAGQPERFLLPNGPREAAELVGVGAAQDRPAGWATGLFAMSGIVSGIYACVLVTLASGPGAAVWAAVLVAIMWAAARALVRALASSVTGARARGRCVALCREDSKRIAHRAACGLTDALRADDCDNCVAFANYHEALVSLVRFELAAGQALAAHRDLARLLHDDPLRSVAAQMAQDKAVRAVAHRAAARAAADRLRSRDGQERATRSPGSA